MKKLRIMLAALMAIVALTMNFEAKAQTKVWSFGPEAGVSFSKYGKDASPNDFKPGAVGGLFVTYSIINMFGVTAKFLVHQRGASFESANTKQTLTYVEVPIVGRYFFNREGKFRPNIFVGPSFSFLTGVRNKVGSNDPEEIGSYKDDYNSVDLGVTTGAGVNIRIHNETYLVLDARYLQGFTDLSKSPDNKVNNHSFALTAGVSFGF
jgi:outer membrane protein W